MMGTIGDASGQRVIDLRSDTVTRPTAAMRAAMAEADVGDDVLDGDPTTRMLEERAASVLGKEAALFFPTGTMANQTAIRVLSRPGTEVLADSDAHIVHMEMAGVAALSGAQLRMVSDHDRTMTAEALRRAIRAPSRFTPSASLLCIENTHSYAGGIAMTADETLALRHVATDIGVPVHLDGARLWNAAIATGGTPAALAAHADTVMVSFSKGLGAPIGAALAGSGAVISAAAAVRKRFGGGMRQSGMMAAGALYGLECNMERIAHDHANARLLASLIGTDDGWTVLTPQTNIVMVLLPENMDAFRIEDACAREGVRVVAWNRSRLRLVTHLDVDESGVKRAGDILLAVLEACSGN